jgi:predicted dinucleotide-utilizing enzyme
MEALQILEQKIARLIESKKQDVDLILELRADNARLKDQLEKLENSLLVHHQTKMVVDDLIRSIDLLVEQESQQGQ